VESLSNDALPKPSHKASRIMRASQAVTLQVKRRQAAFDVLLTTYELIMAPADGQRLSQLRWNYIMCALIKSAAIPGPHFWGTLPTVSRG